jgi:hypothetical protein
MPTGLSFRDLFPKLAKQRKDFSRMLGLPFQVGALRFQRMAACHLKSVMRKKEEGMQNG